MHVVYGSPIGLAVSGSIATPAQFWTRGPGAAFTSGEQYGYSLAAGNFDNDAYADLATSVPGMDLIGVTPSGQSASFADAGVIHVLHGAATAGLSNSRRQVLSQDSSGIQDAAELGDRLGG